MFWVRKPRYRWRTYTRNHIIWIHAPTLIHLVVWLWMDRTLKNKSIVGTLPPAIGNLTNLVYLWVSSRTECLKLNMKVKALLWKFISSSYRMIIGARLNLISSYFVPRSPCLQEESYIVLYFSFPNFPTRLKWHLGGCLHNKISPLTDPCLKILQELDRQSRAVRTPSEGAWKIDKSQHIVSTYS